MNVRRIFLLVVVYFIVVSAAFVGVHLNQRTIPQEVRSYSELLQLLSRNYVTPVELSQIVVQSFEGVRKLVGEEELTVTEEGARVVLTDKDGARLGLALLGDHLDLARRFTEGIDWLAQRYREKFSAEEIETAAMRQAVQSLDPHSSYMTAEEYVEIMDETQGTFGGVGIEITMRDEQLTVIAPIEGTPAFEAGVKAGDQIREVSGTSTKGLSLFDAVKLIRGELGTSVVLGIWREGLDDLLQLEMERAAIRITAVKYWMREGGIGHVRITVFNKNTMPDLRRALSELENDKQPFKSLILDLRNCPGGLLDQAVETADLFLDRGMIVYIDGRNSGQHRKFHASSSKTRTEIPIVVLVNQGSASASEIVAGALLDHHRALLVGSKTWGKGSVQSILPLSDGGAVRLTTALYYTPSDRSIQAQGILPHVRFVYRLEDGNEYKSFGEKDLEGVIPNETEKPDQGAVHRIDGERVYEFYKRQGLLVEDDFDAPDSQILFCLEILGRSAGRELPVLLDSSAEVIKKINQAALPPLQAAFEPALPAEEASP